MCGISGSCPDMMNLKPPHIIGTCCPMWSDMQSKCDSPWDKYDMSLVRNNQCDSTECLSCCGGMSITCSCKAACRVLNYLSIMLLCLSPILVVR